MLITIMQNSHEPFLYLALLPFILAFLFVVPLVITVYMQSNTVKRLHDINLSGWYVLVFWAIQIVFANIDGIVLILGSLLTLLLACIPGTKGENKYGEQPN